MTTSTQLGTITTRLAQANARDTQEQLVILDEIRAVRRHVELAGRVDLVGCVEAATLLTEYLTRMGCVGPEGILRVVSKLMQTVQAAVEQPSEPATSARSGPATAGAASQGSRAEPASRAPASRTLKELITTEEAQRELRMVSDRVLGELLIDMKVITREQLEQALFVQRAAGIRIGEAFVQIGAATWKQIEEALKVQASMRTNAKRIP